MSRKNWLLHLQFVFLVWVMIQISWSIHTQTENLKRRLDCLSDRIYEMDMYNLKQFEEIKKALEKNHPYQSPHNGL